MSDKTHVSTPWRNWEWEHEVTWPTVKAYVSTALSLSLSLSLSLPLSRDSRPLSYEFRPNYSLPGSLDKLYIRFLSLPSLLLISVVLFRRRRCLRGKLNPLT